MTWTTCGTIQVSRDWQYTEPIASGSYFRLKHTEAPSGGLFAIAQCEVDSDGKLSIGDSQILAVEKGVSDVVKLPLSAYTNRRIAIKKVTSLPSLEQEIRRLFLPNFLMPIEQEISYIRRNNWQIEIEVSDEVEVIGTDYTDRFSAIDTKLSTIEQKISSNTPSSAAPQSSTKLLTYSSFGDTNGLFYFAGTGYGSAQTWSHPALSNQVEIYSFARNTSANQIIDRDVNTGFASREGAGNTTVDFTVNLKTKKLKVTDLTVLFCNAPDTRRWGGYRLEGSNDKQAWNKLFEVNYASDTNPTCNAVYSSPTWLKYPIANDGQYYQYLRLSDLSQDYNGYWLSGISEIEFYGELK